MPLNSLHVRRALIGAATIAITALAACEGEGSSPSGNAPAASPTPTPVAAPTPAPAVSYVPTPVPFNLTQSRTLDVFGWDSWPAAPVPSAIQFRWNAATGRYEVLATGYADWGRLEALQDTRFGGTPYQYDVFRSDGAKFPFTMPLAAPPHIWPHDGFVGTARIFESAGARAYFAFGIATAPGNVPTSGTKKCTFGMDEIGGGEITFDFSAGTASGWVEPFWAPVGSSLPRYQLVQVGYPSGATTVTSSFGTDPGWVLEGRFYGPGAVNIAVRAKGGVSGLMIGTCSG